MNHPATGTLDSRQLATLTADLTGLVEDSDTAASVTIWTPRGGSMDPVTGAHVSDAESDDTTGWTGPLTLREIAESGGVYQRGDQRLVIMAESLTLTPSTASRFRVGSTTFAVVTAERDPLGLSWQLVGRPN